MTDWGAWSRAAWRRHLPDVADPLAFVREAGNGTVHGVAHATAMAAPDRPAIRLGADEVARLAQQVSPGDRVLIAAPPSIAWIACYLGTLRAGGIAVLANPAYTDSELGQIRDAATPVMVIGEPAQMLADAPEPWVERSTPDAVALLAFTSGTTGRPKGVPLTHRNLLTSIRAAMTAWRWKPRDILAHGLPLFHQHGLGGVHATLIAGSRLNLLARYEPESLAIQLDRAKATILFAVPTMYQRLPEEAHQLVHLRLCVSGSAQLSRAVAVRAELALGKAPLVRYGTTESGLDTSQVYSDPRNPVFADTIGLPLPGVQVRLADDGEIQLRGPQVFGGYWRDDATTPSAFTSDGWFRTGDIGALDEATGHLAIRGRTKDVIITGGLNVHPREVELALEKHPAIAEAAVAGVPSTEWGEQVTAWVVMKDGARFDEAALIAHAHRLLAPYKCPKRVLELYELPRNAMGKLDRSRLGA